MSEYQNRAIELMHMQEGIDSLSDLDDRREAFMRAAIQLYQAMGGDPDELAAGLEDAYSQPPPGIDVAIGDVLYTLAGVGHGADLDIIQAAYNKLDRAVQPPAPDR
jgi:hypothetical protein